MNGQEFLKELKAALEGAAVNAAITSQEAGEIFQYYTEYLADAGEMQMESEEEIIRRIGSIEDIVKAAGEQTQGRKNAEESKGQAEDKSEAPELGVFRNIDINALAVKVSLILSDKNAIEYQLSSLERLIACEVDKKTQTLVVRTKRKFGISVAGWIQPGYIRVYYNDKNTFDRISVATVSGQIEAGTVKAGQIFLSTVSGGIEGRGICGTSIEAKTVSGKIALEDVGSGQNTSLKLSAVSGGIALNRVSTGDFLANTTSGDIHADTVCAGRISAQTVSGGLELCNVTASGCTCKTTSGRITVAGKLLGANKFNSISGGVLAHIQGIRSEYDCVISTVSGSTRIDGQKFKGSYKNNQPNEVSANTVSGGISIEFNGLAQGACGRENNI